MSKVVVDLSMSLDGYITDPHESVGNQPSDDPGRLHDWMFANKTDADADLVDEKNAAAGAIVVGRRMFDLGVGPWGDPPPFHKPVFVVTHRSHEPIPKMGGTTYIFVTGGIEAALEQAKAAAGDRNVAIWGGANIVQQYLKARLVDELHIHLVPVLLGEGVRLFEHSGLEPIELKRTRTIDTPSATHLQFTVVR